MKNLFVCGDSYACGIGLKQEYNLEKSFGGLISKKYGIPHINYARGGICNFGIYLQVKKMLDTFDFTNHDTKNSLMIISLTNPGRLMVATEDITFRDLDLSNVDYLNNSPYAYNGQKGRDVQFSLNKKPKLFSQTILDIASHIEKNVSGAMPSAYEILPKYKLNALKSYIENLYDDPIKEEYDYGIISKMHLMLKLKNVNHIFLVQFKELFYFLPEENLCEVNWRKISDEHPDEIGSSHCNEVGHEIAAQIILDHLPKRKLI